MIEAMQKGDEVVTAGMCSAHWPVLPDALYQPRDRAEHEINLQKTAVQVLLPKGTLKNIQ